MMNHADEEQNEMTLLVSMIAFRHTARAVIGPTKLDDHPFNIIIICQQWTEISGDLPLLGTAPLVKWTRQVNLNICSDRKMANDLTVDLQSVHSTDASTCGQSAIETFCYCSAVAHPALMYYHRVGTVAEFDLINCWLSSDLTCIVCSSAEFDRRFPDQLLIASHFFHHHLLGSIGDCQWSFGQVFWKRSDSSTFLSWFVAPAILK